MVNVPCVAVALAVIVNDDAVPAVEAGTNTAVAPVGRPSAARVTTVTKAVRVRAMFVTLLVPRATDNAAGLTASVTPSPGVTVSATVTVWFAAPAEVAVMVSVAGPSVALTAVVTTSDAAVPVVLAGVTTAVTPVGAPVTANAIAPVRFVRVIARLLLPVEPCETESVAGVATTANENAVTTSVCVAVTAVTPVPVALMVIGYEPGTVAVETFSVTVPVETLPAVAIADTVLVTPAGCPATATVGVPVNPPAPVTVTKTLEEPPCGAVLVAEFSETAIDGVGAVVLSDLLHA